MVLASTLAFLSAFTFAASNTMLRRGVMKGTVAQAMAVTVPMGALIGWAALATTGVIGHIDLGSDLMMFSSLAGIIHFAAGRYCQYRAIQAMGANLVAPVQQTSVVITLMLAIVMLGEVPTSLQMAGIAIVLVSPLLLVRKHEQPSSRQSNAFNPNLKHGYFFASLAAFAFGVSPIFIGLGLQDLPGLATGLASGTIAYTAAAIVLLTIVVCTRPRFAGVVASRASLGWYAASGVTVAASQLLGYMALAIAPVSVVVPIQRTSIILRFGLAGAFNRDAEVFGTKMLLAIVLSLSGALMIAVDPAHAHALIERLLARL